MFNSTDKDFKRLEEQFQKVLRKLAYNQYAFFEIRVPRLNLLHTVELRLNSDNTLMCYVHDVPIKGAVFHYPAVSFAFGLVNDFIDTLHGGTGVNLLSEKFKLGRVQTRLYSEGVAPAYTKGTSGKGIWHASRANQ